MMLLEINDEHLRLLEFLKTSEGRMELIKRSLADDPRAWSPEDRRIFSVLLTGNGD